MKKKVAVVTLFLAQYRKGFLDTIFSNENYEITVYCQEDIKGLNLKLIHNEYPHDRVKVFPHYNFNNFTFIWQFMPWKEIYQNDIIFIDGNPRVVNHFLMASLLKFTNKKIVLWSMVHSFQNNKFNEWLRVTWMRMFKYHFLYNDGEVEYLKSIGFRNKLMIGMNNGIDQSKIDEEIERWSTERLLAWRIKTLGSERLFDIITLGRLLPGKYEFLINAIVDLKKDIPDIKCCIVGDGVGRKDLENLAIKMDVQSNIYFAGALYLEQDLAPYLLSAKMLVHPTAMGLTIMHGFGYGLPVITHDDYKYHGPEIIAHKDMENGLLYKNGDMKDFNIKIKKLYFDNELRSKFSKNAKDLVTKKYNTSQMASNFFKLLSELK